jgi:hypothetical protein
MKQTLRLTTLCFISAFVAGLAFAQKDASWIGDYSSTTDFTISTPAQLKALADTVNATSNSLDFDGKTIVLANDINLSGYACWAPIGKSSTAKFKGTFNGRHHIIYNLKITSLFPNGGNNECAAGLFGYIENATLDSLIVGDSISHIGNNVDFAGGIVAHSTNSIIKQCVAFGILNVKIYTDGNAAGGIVGYATGSTISQCANYDSINTIKGAGNVCTGGIAGKLQGTSKILYCYNQGNITSNWGYSGGILGYLDNTNVRVDTCFNVGSVNNSGTTNYSSGIVGYTTYAPTKITYSYNIGNIISTNKGAIVGNSGSGIPSNCYFDYCQSGVNIPKGNAPSDSIGKKHTIDMLQQATYSTWDFTNVWTLDDNAFPYFVWLLDDRDAEGNYLFEQTIAVMPQPTIILPADGNLCQSDSLLLVFTGSEDFSLTGTGLPANIAPTDSTIHTVAEICGQLYRTYTVKIPVQTTGNLSVTITSLADAFCTSNTGATQSYTVNPKPAFTLTPAAFCEGATVPITITGANSSAITFNIVGKNDCEKCGVAEKWTTMGLSSPTTNESGSYLGNITGTSNGNWTFHVNSVTIAGCTIANPNQQIATICP